MTSSKFRLAGVACSMTLLLSPAIVRSQSSTMELRVAALKQSVARAQQTIRQYEWIETTVISVKGEEKSRQQKQCYYGAEGSLQKVEVSGSPPPGKKRGLRGRIAENKNYLEWISGSALDWTSGGTVRPVEQAKGSIRGSSYGR